MKKVKFSMVKDGVYKYGLSFHDYRRITTKKSILGVAFWRYYICGLTEEKKSEILQKYSNVSFGYVQCEYSPEIKYDVLMEFDKAVFSN